MTVIVRDLFKIMHGLQQQVVEIGKCPKCHQKSLVSRHNDGENEWFQCGRCRDVYLLPARRLVG